jgi:hypothetical protein
MLVDMWKIVEWRTCDDSRPPHRALEICEAVSFKAMLLTSLHQAFFCDDETRSLFKSAAGTALLEGGRITYRKRRSDG